MSPTTLWSPCVTVCCVPCGGWLGPYIFTVLRRTRTPSTPFPSPLLQMEKTEATMTELQIAKNIDFEFERMTEAGATLEPLSGAGCAWPTWGWFGGPIGGYRGLLIRSARDQDFLVRMACSPAGGVVGMRKS